jgi:hypothetical protein
MMTRCESVTRGSLRNLDAKDKSPKPPHYVVAPFLETIESMTADELIALIDESSGRSGDR